MTAMLSGTRTTWVKPDKQQRAAKRAAKTWHPAHEPLDIDECPWWDEPERWEPEQMLPDYPYPFPVLSDTTEWTALGLEASTQQGYYLARCDSFGVQFTTPHSVVACGVVRSEHEYTAQAPIETQPILSETVEWCALAPDEGPLTGAAWRDSGYAYFSPYDPKVLIVRHLMFDGLPNYDTAEPPAAVSPFTPFALLDAWSVTTPVMTRLAYKGAKQVLYKIPAENDCLHAELPIQVIPPPVVAPNGHRPVPITEHLIEPLMLIDGRPETVERQQRRLASCSLRKPGEVRTVFYDREAPNAVH